VTSRITSPTSGAARDVFEKNAMDYRQAREIVAR